MNKCYEWIKVGFLPTGLKHPDLKVIYHLKQYFKLNKPDLLLHRKGRAPHRLFQLLRFHHAGNPVRQSKRWLTWLPKGNGRFTAQTFKKSTT